MSFKKFDLSDELYMGLSDVRYEDPTPIQEASIPIILEGKDLIGAAQTGTGKTGAFIIPLMDKILKNKSEHTQALILTPTRELAQQIDEQIFAIGYHSGITSATVIGGSDFSTQAKSIRAGVDIIVATPGRFIDQMNVLNLDFSHLKYLVLDEADRMLDMGFLPDVSKIVESLPKERQTLLFSATMPDAVQKVVKKIMKNPEKIKFEISKPVDSVDQQVYFVPANQRLMLIESLFDSLDWSTAIIFTATKRGTDQLEHLLKKRNVKVVSMHGDRSQEERNEALRMFRNKTYPVMVATDVLARGIDIDNVSLIINYDVPNSPDDYIHRIGRTGRYDKTGTAITFVTPSGKKFFHPIKKIVGDQLSIIDLPEALTSPEKIEQKHKENKSSKNSKSADLSKSKFARSARSGEKQKPGNREELPPRPSSERDKKEKQSVEVQPQKDQIREGDDINSEIDNMGKPRYRSLYYPDGSEEEIFEAQIIEKAVSRNKRARKPAKGIWGIIKSFIPKLIKS